MTFKYPPIISIIGRSGVGKTTFLTRLVSELKERGHRLTVIKHHRHVNVELDQPGKDTWRHFQAGADSVIIAGPDKMAMYRRLSRDQSPEELVTILPDPVDLVLTEGFREATNPAIEIVRAAHCKELVGAPSRLMALVTDLSFPLDLPHFALDDVVGVADLLENRFALSPGLGDPPPVER